MTSLADRSPPRVPRRAPALAANAAVPAWDGSGATFRVAEAPWGFRVRPRAGWRPLRRLGQAAAVLVGAAAVAAGLSLAGPALWGPGDVAADARLAQEALLGALLGGAGLLLLRWAARGSLVETEVDVARGEVRQVARGLAGWRTRLAAQRFGAVTQLRLERAGGGLEVLVLDTAGGALAVASGTRAALAPLRRRLERDLMPWSRAAGREAAGLGAFARARSVGAAPSPDRGALGAA